MYQFKTVVVDFTVDDKPYYTFANYDDTKSESTNVDTALAYIQQAIFKRGTLEAHAGDNRVFINLSENSVCSILGAKVLTLSA